jgi:tetratricopeptide (TPR) repeat protein
VDIPIGLFDDQPVTIRLNNVEQADRLAVFLNDQKMWDRQCDDVINHVQGEYEAIGALPTDKRAKELLPRLEALSAKMKDDIADLKARFEKLKESATEAGDSAKQWLNADLGRMKALDEAYTAMLKLIKDEKDPSPAQKEFNLGMMDEKNYKFDDALKHFQRAKQLEPNNPKFTVKLEKFQKAWRATTAEHKAARAFFVTTWPGLPWRDMRDKFEECEKKMEVLRAQSDYLTAQLLVKTNQDVIEKLRAMLAQPAGSGDEGATDRAADIEDLLLKLRDMNNDLLDFIRPLLGGG